MKHLLRASLLLLTAWCLALVGVQQAYASHAQGGQLTYEYVGNQFNPVRPNYYKVTCRFFRDCSGIDAPDNLTLNCRVGTCSSNDSRNFTATMTRGALTVGTPYCASAGNPCGSARTNYETAKYEAFVTLAPQPRWTLSITESNRPTLANISGAPDLVFEATLNNLLSLPSGQTLPIQNTSPQYLDQDIPVPFVCKSQETTITFSANEPNGDRLEYSLDRPLSACNQPSTYTSFNSNGGIIIDPSSTPTNPCVIVLPSGNTTYSPTFPIPSFTTTGTCPVKSATPSFLFNASTGSFTFTPYLYDANNLANNKYVVVGKITEYRTINGVEYVVGSVRRDMLVIVIDCGGNTVPNPPIATGVTPNSNTTTVNSADSTFINVYSCNYSQVRVRFSDPNPGQQLTVTIDPTALAALSDVVVPNGFVLSGNGTSSPVAAFYFQPSPQLVGTVVRVPVQIADNACPIRGVQSRILVIRVLRGQFATALAAAGAPGLPGNTIPTICPGGSIQLRGSVVRPDSIRGGLQSYTYQWSAANGLDPNDATNQQITVNPTVTTRYQLRIAPVSGFSPGLCGDTTSIVVRVVPEPRASATVNNPIICAGNSATITARASRADGIQDTYTFKWDSADGLDPADENSSIITVRPTVTTRYHVTIKGASPYGCDGDTTIEIRVVPPADLLITADNSTVCPGSPATLTAQASRADGLPDTYTYRWQPANGLSNADLNQPVVTVKPTVATTYTVTVTGSSAYGCSVTKSFRVDLAPPIQAQFSVDSTAGPNNGGRINMPPRQFTFTNTSKVAGVSTLDGIAEATWTIRRLRNALGERVNESEVVFSSEVQPTDPLIISNAGTYEVTLRENTTAGGVSCPEATFSYRITIPDVTQPNVFTPNNDGYNDTFIVQTEQIGNKVVIFNRWGRKVREYSSYNNDWNGDDQPAGVYYYQITARNGKVTKGWVELVR